MLVGSVVVFGVPGATGGVEVHPAARVRAMERDRRRIRIWVLFIKDSPGDPFLLLTLYVSSESYSAVASRDDFPLILPLASEIGFIHLDRS